MLSGYKTYLTGALLGLVSFAGFVGWIDADAQQSLTALLMGGGLTFLRMGVKKGT